MNVPKKPLAASYPLLCAALALALAPLAARAQSNKPMTQSVTTFMFDNYQSGINSNESILRPANVVSGSFGLLKSPAIDGQAYAQPLYLSNLTVNGARHNVAYVATMHDSVYAFDADDATQLWKVSFISADTTTQPQITPVPNTDFPGSGNSDIDGTEVGVESTPVIDESTGTIYVVAKTKETGRGDGHTHYVQRLHALDVATGAEKFNGPKVIGDTTCDNSLNTSTTDSTLYDFNLSANPQTPSAASTNTSADNNVGGRVYFNALRNLQRCSLTLSNGVVYVGWSSHGDSRPYHGWLVGFDATTLLPVPKLVFCSTPDGWQGGIWQGGAGPTVDNDGNLFISVANAGANYCANQTAGNLGESFVKFNPANGLSAKATGFDFWAPGDAPGLGNGDSGVGSGALVLIDVPGNTIQHLCMGGGKNGKIYSVNRDNMGGFVNAGGDRDVQTFTLKKTYYFGCPIFFNNCLFIDSDPIQGYTFNAADSTFTLSGSTNYTYSGRGAGLVISANGTSNALIWSFTQGVMKVVRPESIAGANAQSGVAAQFEVALGDRSTVKFTHPVVVNGKVYAANKTAFLVFGLLNATKPTVTLAATQPTATVGGQAGTFTATRSGSTLGNLLVPYTVGGTAQSGTDYTALSGTVTIPDGAASATVAVTAPSGAHNGAVVSLQVSANANYTLGTSQQAGVTISNANNTGDFTAWQQSQFGSQAGTADAAPAADYDHDGLANLLEYALATNPKASQSTPAYTVSATNNRLTISFNRALTLDGSVTLRVSASNTLDANSWTTLATKTGAAAWVTTAGASVTDNASTGAATVTDSQTISSQPKRFLRITAELTSN